MQDMTKRRSAMIGIDSGLGLRNALQIISTQSLVQAHAILVITMQATVCLLEA